MRRSPRDRSRVRYRLEEVPRKRATPGPGRLPSMERLVEMDDDELARTLKRFGVDPRRAERLMRAMASASERLIGAEAPDAKLVERVVARATTAVSTELRMIAKELIRDYIFGKFAAAKPGRWLWIAVMDKATCDSCDERHNTSHTMEEWEERGLPGDANLLCGAECRCELAPDDWFDGPTPDDVEGDVEVTVEAEHVRD